ncbi:unnamed protein product [Bemisia tabaci]|uniref:Uncharacterized protein n=1 Tax=Bemisia tabaci TaxID=7038 RepID=A0A9P0AIZ7_BEMTA|nr:unnamed protein product [Bemisia tabaci]
MASESEPEENAECGQVMSPHREEEQQQQQQEEPEPTFVATQALQDEELTMNEEKKKASEKKRTEQQKKKVETHPLAQLLQELISFADEGLAPLPRVLDELRGMIMHPMFYSDLEDPQQKDLLKIMRAFELKMKKLKQQGKQLRACGWRDLEQLMEKEPFYTTFTRIVLEEPVKTYVCDSFLNLERELISPPDTETTCTYVTHATTSTAHADATSRRSSGANSESGYLDHLLAHETSASKDGVISQFICHQDRGTSLRLTTPGEIGYEIVKIEVYPFSEVVNEDRMNWWRSARTRALIHFNSPLDTELQTIKRIIDRKAKEISELEGTEKKVTRASTQDKSDKGKGSTRAKTY